MKKHTNIFIVIAIVFLAMIGIGYYLSQPQEKEVELPADSEANIFMPEAYDKKSKPQMASILDSSYSSVKKFDYKTDEKSNQDFRDAYANCIRKAKINYSPNAYSFSKITCEQDVYGFLEETEEIKDHHADELLAWWKKATLPSAFTGFQETLNCMKSETGNDAERILDKCWGEKDSSEYRSNLIYFAGTWMRKDVNNLVAYAFSKDQVDYIYLGGRPGEHTFKPYDEEDAYFWYCYFQEEPTYFSKIFKNVRFEKKACAPHGDVIYFDKSDGPTSCCDRNAEIVSAAYPEDITDFESECIRPENEIRGRCMSDWYEGGNEYCGDNICQNREPRNENQCTCPQDCPEKNTISFTETNVSVQENAEEPVRIKIKRSYPAGPGMRIEYKAEGTGSNPVSLSDYEFINKPSLRFDKGEEYVEILIQPKNDYDEERDEQLSITLSSPSTSVVPMKATDEAVIGKPDTVTVTIIDND